MMKPADLLKDARKRAGFTGPAEAARAHGWKESTYTSHENGTRRITDTAARRYAGVFDVKAADLMGWRGDEGGEGSAEKSIGVIGDFKMGLWQDTSIDRDGEKSALRLPQAVGGVRKRLAVKAADESANRYILPGEFAIFELITPEDALDLAVGSLVVVERWNGPLRERSIRRVRAKSGSKMDLACHSTEARFNQVVTYPSGKSSDRVEIVGVVVGKYAEFTI
jgi:transcriptional regulator with XRE-family HTH domain